MFGAVIHHNENVLCAVLLLITYQDTGGLKSEVADFVLLKLFKKKRVNCK